jgi:hypothetical protein
MQQQQGNPLGLILIVVLLVIFLRQPPSPNPPSPDPPPPVPPPVTRLTGIVRAIVTRLLPGQSRSAEARQLAAVYRSLADEIDSLRDPLSPSPLKRPADPIAAAHDRGKTALGSRWDDWRPAIAEINAELAAQDARGEIGRSIYDVGRVFRELAHALETIP